MDEILRQSGVTETTLSVAEKLALDQQGYIVLPGVLDEALLAELRTAFEREAGQHSPDSNQKQTGTRHTEDLRWQDPVFARFYTAPKILAATWQVLQRPFRVSGYSGRDPLPGYGQQGLHNDWMMRLPGDPFIVVTALGLLDDYTHTNGATRLIPGSHLWPKPLPKQMQQPDQHHPAEQFIIAPAGSALIFNGHLWHSGTRNESTQSRRILQLTFVAREMARPEITEHPPIEKFSPAARALLGI